ncbi:hypothetical protein MTR67_039826 [Solanum verrucosum]|uniref:Reverse transcriptase RNase H-like domain-containing protein n=1 Tax=Solanum verrucosum TaxID=315347 RepID=A0AAF0ZP92_SOLVR|nr:hypothetical protein MTR67_039826 [Solanum verrucosum]
MKTCCVLGQGLGRLFLLLFVQLDESSENELTISSTGLREEGPKGLDLQTDQCRRLASETGVLRVSTYRMIDGPWNNPRSILSVVDWLSETRDTDFKTPTLESFPMDHELYAKFRKYWFWWRFFAFLGHIVSGEDIQVYPKTTEAMQYGKVIAYASRQLKVHEKNYRSHDLDVATVVFSVQIWRHYLYGVHVDVFTDPKILKYVLTQKDLNLRQRKCLEFLKDYDMSVLYNSGKENVVANALSRLSMGSVAYV